MTDSAVLLLVVAALWLLAQACDIAAYLPSRYPIT